MNSDLPDSVRNGPLEGWVFVVSLGYSLSRKLGSGHTELELTAGGKLLPEQDANLETVPCTPLETPLLARSRVTTSRSHSHSFFHLTLHNLKVSASLRHIKALVVVTELPRSTPLSF